MDKTNKTTPGDDAYENIILGIASVETQGIPDEPDEPLGLVMPAGISER